MEVNRDMDSRVHQAADVLKQYGAREVYLFGSAANGTARADSDVDLAVSGLPPVAFFQAMARAGQVLGRTLDLIDLDEANPFTQYLRQQGKLIRVA